MTARRISALLALASAAAAAAAASPPAPGSTQSGLYGTVTRGPTRPVCEIDQPCSEPAAGVTLRFLRSGRVVLRVVTGPRGGYRARLRAGTYAVRTDQRPFGTIPGPSTVRVVAGRFRRVNFTIDTGIR